MKKKILFILLSLAVFTAETAFGADIGKITYDKGRYTISGTTVSGAQNVVMQMLEENSDSSNPGVADIVYFGQTKAKQSGTYSFSIPETGLTGSYILKVRDDLDGSYTQKTVSLVPSTESGILMQNDFSADTDGFVMRDGSTGSFGISGGYLRIDPSTGEACVYYDGMYSASNYEYNTLVSGINGSQIKMLFRYSSNKYYWFGYTVGSGSFEFGAYNKNNVPQSKIISSTENSALAVDVQEHKITLKVNGGNMSAYIDDVLVLEGYDDDIDYGSVGIIASSGQIYINDAEAKSDENIYGSLKLGKIKLLDSDLKEMTVLYPNSEIYAQVEAKNISAVSSASGRLIMCVYGANGKMKSIGSNEINVEPGESAQTFIKLNYTYESGDTVKLFVWSGDGKMVPLSKAKETSDSVSEADVVLYVSTQGALDADGSFEKPYGSIQAAIDKADEIFNHRIPANGITIYVRGGEYRLDSSVSIDRDFSVGASNQPLTIASYPGEKAVFTTSRVIDLSQAEEVRDASLISRLPAAARGKVYQIDLGAQGITLPAFGSLDSSNIGNYAVNTELYANGEKMTLSRYPNSGYGKIGGITASDSTARTATFSIASGSGNQSKWSYADQAKIYAYWGMDYYYDSADITAVNTAGTSVSVSGLKNFMPKQGQRYCIQNLFEEIDMPGEWFVDRSTNTLYYYPIEGLSKMEISSVTAPVISIKENANVVIRNIEINKANCGISITGASNIGIVDCEIKNIGAYGIKSQDSNSVSIENCDIYNIGSNGIFMFSTGNMTTLAHGNSRIVNNRIHGCGQFARAYAPGINYRGTGGEISHNVIYDMPHAAVIFGGSENNVMYNEIYNSVTESSDMSAIYTGGAYISRGNKIKYNYIHDISLNVADSEHSVMGIYNDNFGSGLEISSNIFKNTHTGIFQNGGRDNVIKDNIFINEDDYVGKRCWVYLRDSGLLDMYKPTVQRLVDAVDDIDFTSEAWQKYPELESVKTDVLGAPVNNVCEGNVIYNHGESRIGNDYEIYSAVGVNPIFTSDIGFFDNGNGDFGLNPNSVIYEEIPTFPHIPFDKIGNLRYN